MRLRGNAVAAVVVSAAALLVPIAASGAQAGAAAKQPLFDSELTGTPIKVVSSTGKKLLLTVSGDEDNDGGLAAELLPTLSTPAHTEQHQWGLAVPLRGYAISDAGRGKITAPAAVLAPFGRVNLAVTPHGPPKVLACGGAATITTAPVTLKGTIFFDTRSTGSNKWGTIGTSRKPLAINSTAAVRTIRGSGADAQTCYPLLYSACANSLNFVTGYADAGVAALGGGYDEVNGTMHGYVSGERGVDLKKPVGAFRHDTVRVPAPVPTFTDNGADGATLAVTTSGHGASGSGTVSSAAESNSYTADCSKQTPATLNSWSAEWANGSTPMSIHADIYGNFVAADSTHAVLKQYVRTS